MARTHLGEFEQVLLYALARLGGTTDGAAGLDVARVIEARTGRVISPGAIYTGLSRLEARRLVASVLGDPTPQRGGKRKRLYRATPAGLKVLAASHAALGEMARGLKPKLQQS
jgi:PadR family transcriptional regulator PadR